MFRMEVLVCVEILRLQYVTLQEEDDDSEAMGFDLFTNECGEKKKSKRHGGSIGGARGGRIARRMMQCSAPISAACMPPPPMPAQKCLTGSILKEARVREQVQIKDTNIYRLPPLFYMHVLDLNSVCFL